jgi:hypothetical protein
MSASGTEFPRMDMLEKDRFGSHEQPCLLLRPYGGSPSESRRKVSHSRYNALESLRTIFWLTSQLSS